MRRRTMSDVKRNILITGATGQVGSAVIRALKGGEGDDAINLIAAGRSQEKAATLGVAWRELDYDDGSTMGPALQDIDSVFMVTDYTVGMLRQSKAFINAAKRAGVRHIVHLGAPGDDDTNVDHWGWHQFIERYIEWSGFSFTHLRPEIFMQNLLGYGGSEAERDGAIRHYIGDARISWVDVRDVAAVAAVALQHPAKHAGKTYHLGYDAKTYPEVAAILSKVVGQPFTYDARPPKEFLDAMLAAGADVAYMSCVYQNWIDYEAGTIPGADAVYDNFFELTGRQPRNWEQFAQENAAAFKY